MTAPQPAGDWTEVQVVGVEFTGPHGVGAHERAEGRRFRVKARVRLIDCPAAASDDLAQTLNYAEVAALIVQIGTNHSYHLVERLAEVIAQALLSLPRVAQVALDVRKHAPGLPGAPPWVGVRVQRANPAGSAR
jgi:dihydroneopterin aldolase